MPSIRLRALLLLVAVCLVSGFRVSAQAQNAKAEVGPEITPDIQPISGLGLQEQIAPKPLSPAVEFRRAIRRLDAKGRPFVHCKLVTGKVLTGRLGQVSDASFSIQTDALGENHFIYYEDLAEAPYAAPAAGTRLKQGFEIVGFALMVIVLFPLLLISGTDC